ncbi:ABC transporter substrate-binding protein [Pigmentiphaga soli]|uniref:ABC transporter substrate-binding protein n=1 Tax=Pigmentiphaga soli TaxID=1007095 RepID=A0ABP8H3X8_9BURK
MSMKSMITGLALGCGLAASAAAQAAVKIGFVTTLSGPAGVMGQHMKEGAELALAELGGKMAGQDVQIIFGDDQLKPDVGRQLTETMIKRDDVDFLAGVIFSNVMLAMYQPIVRSGKIFVSASAGPSQIAGKMCAPNFFSTAWQNDQSPEAMGRYLAQKNVQDVYLMAPNYAAGKDMIQGFKRYYKGKIAAEVYTKLDQSDYQAEFTQIRAANPGAIFMFYPGGLGVQILKQYAQSGLEVPVYTSFTANETTLPALGKAAAGIYDSGFWSPDLKIPRNQAFVASYRAKYGHLPSDYAAASYDAINLIASAVRATGGKLDDQAALQAAMRKADFQSVRGSFSFNVNQFPIQDYYVFKVAADADGSYVRKTEALVLPKHKDAYYAECKTQ